MFVNSRKLRFYKKAIVQQKKNKKKREKYGTITDVYCFSICSKNSANAEMKERDKKSFSLKVHSNKPL